MRRVPVAIWLSIAIEVVFAVIPLLYKDAYGNSYYLTLMGCNAASSLFMALGMGELAERLPASHASGARLASYGFWALLGLVLTAGLMTMSYSETMQTIWKLRSLLACAAYVVAAVGIVGAAGGFGQQMAAGAGLLVFAVISSPPWFLVDVFVKALGADAYRYTYVLGTVGFVGVLAVLVTAAAQMATLAPIGKEAEAIALMGRSLRARVIALFIVLGLTLVAVGSRGVAGIKLSMISSAIVNVAAFVMFAVAALRLARYTGPTLLSLAGGAAAWCAGVTALQAPAMWQMFDRDRDSFASERSQEMARALQIPLPLLAGLSVILALLAVGSYLRARSSTAAESIGPRATTFVVLSLTSAYLSISLLPKVRSMDQLLALTVFIAAAGIGALLVAASTFKKASESVYSTTQLPTATVLPPE